MYIQRRIDAKRKLMHLQTSGMHQQSSYNVYTTAENADCINSGLGNSKATVLATERGTSRANAHY